MPQLVPSERAPFRDVVLDNWFTGNKSEAAAVDRHAVGNSESNKQMCAIDSSTTLGASRPRWRAGTIKKGVRKFVVFFSQRCTVGGNRADDFVGVSEFFSAFSVAWRRGRNRKADVQLEASVRLLWPLRHSWAHDEQV